MQTIEIQKGVKVGLEEMLNSVTKMDTLFLEKFMVSVNQIFAGRKAAATANREAELLEKINNVVPTFAKLRYQRLHSKFQKGTATDTERTEMLQIIDFMEEKAVERIHLMAELAALRQVSLKELTEQSRASKSGTCLWRL